MANYSTLKGAITRDIKENHDNLITGNLLQQALIAMVDALGAGYQFVGVATPATNPGTPDYNVVYLAGPGTYPNFGSASIADGKIGSLKYNGSWVVETIDAGKNYDAEISEILSNIANLYERVAEQEEGISIFEQTIREQIENYRPIVIEGNVVNAPDEEDITTDGNDLLKFKNRNNLNGKGYFIVRSGASIESQITLADTTYEIRYNFDLGGATLNVPSGCVLNFVGGKITGTGTVNGNGSIIKSDGVCFGENIVLSGTWKNEIIYTKWFNFRVSDDGVTDNVLCFKQLEAVINGTSGCKVEFEPGYYQTSIPNKTGAGQVTVGGVEYTKWITNDGPIWNPDDTVLFIKNIPYVDINLNGAEIHAINVFCPKWAGFLFRSIDNAKLHDGKIFGVAGPSFGYPEYVNASNVVVRNYEFPSLIFQQGGYCDFYNLTVSNSEGDGITVGTGSRSLGGGLYEYFYAKGYRVSGCEIMYCGRNGIVVHSSGGTDDGTEIDGTEALPGVLEQLYIHNIGSDAASGVIGSDGIMGFNPRGGIDVEFEEGAKGRPVLRWDTLLIESCARQAFGFAQEPPPGAGSRMKSFYATNVRTLGAPPVLENLKADGVAVFDGCAFQNDDLAQYIGRDIVYNDCVFDIRARINLGFGKYNDCDFIDNTDGSDARILDQNSNTGQFYNCRFKLKTSSYVSCKDFYSCKFELSGTAKRLYIGGAKFFDCELSASESSAASNWAFLIGNIPGDFFFKGCTIKNVYGVSSSGSGRSLVLNTSSATLDDCLIIGNFSASVYYNSVAKKLNIQRCTFENEFLLEEFTPSGTTTGETNGVTIRHSTVAGVLLPHNFVNGKVKGYICDLLLPSGTPSRSQYCIFYGCIIDGWTEAQYTDYGGQGKGNTFITE